jgi:SAM-dependent methyltransferase
MSKREHDAAVAELRQQISRMDKPWYRSSSSLLKQENIKGLRCLDLCSGNGEFSQILRDEHDMEVVCADYIPFHLQKVEKEGFRTISVDIDRDSEQIDRLAESYKASFDLVVNLAAIEHVYNSDNLLRFAHRVLKPGGHLLVNTPNISFLAYRIYSVFSGNRPFGEGHHVRFWDYRFLRTNLFLNGFSVTADGRAFYALPEDAMLRAFRNKKGLAGFISWFFHGCRIFQNVPPFRGLCCDELTVLAKRDDTPAVGFELNQVKRFFDDEDNKAEAGKAVGRFKEAQERGWLKEHLYLSRFVDTL